MAESDPQRPEDQHPPDLDASGETQRAAKRLRNEANTAITDLYVRVTPAIHAYAALNLGRRWIGVEDVVAQVWLRALGRIDAYDDSRPFRPWIFGVAKNVVKEAQRKLLRSPALPVALSSDRSPSSILENVPASISSASSRAARDEGMALFLAWVETELSRYERDVLILRGIEERPHSEVAKILSKSEHAVTVCWARVLEKVKARRVPESVIGPAD